MIVEGQEGGERKKGRMFGRKENEKKECKKDRGSMNG